MTAYELEEKLVNPHRSMRPKARFVWDSNACADVERE